MSTKTIRLLALVFYKRYGDEPGRKIALVYSNCQFDRSETFTSSLPVLIKSKWLWGLWVTELWKYIICNHRATFLIHRSQNNFYIEFSREKKSEFKAHYHFLRTSAEHNRYKIYQDTLYRESTLSKTLHKVTNVSRPITRVKTCSVSLEFALFVQ